MSKQGSNRRASYRMEMETLQEADISSLFNEPKQQQDSPQSVQDSFQSVQDCDKKRSVSDNNQVDEEHGKQTRRTTPVKTSTDQSHIRTEAPVNMTKLIHENSMLKQKVAHLSRRYERELQAQLQQMRSIHERMESNLKNQMAILEKREKDALKNTKKAQAQVEELTCKLQEYEAKQHDNSKLQTVTGPALPQRRGNGSPIPYGHHTCKYVGAAPTREVDSGRTRITSNSISPPPVTGFSVPSINQYRLTTSPQRAAQASAACANHAATYSTGNYSLPSPIASPYANAPPERSSRDILEKKPSSGGILSYCTSVLTGTAPSSTKVTPQWTHNEEKLQQNDYTMSIPTTSSTSPSSSTESASPSSLTSRILNAASTTLSSYYTAKTPVSPTEENSPC